MHTTDTLIQHALSIRWANTPQSSRQAALTFLHDSLAVGVAGSREPLAPRVYQLARRWTGDGGTSIVLGYPGERLSAPYAAYVNGFHIHNQEFDAVHEMAVAHPMATVVSALLADCGRQPGITGEAFLTALISGVETVAALGMFATSSLKFFRPSVAGIFGCVAALARLRNLSPGQTRIAFGHALCNASGSMQAHVEGKPTLALQVAAAARSAVMAIDLCLAEYPAPEHAIDGPFGYNALFETTVDVDPVLARLGKAHAIEELSWKPFPTGRAAQGAIVALQTLIKTHGLTEQSIAQFIYRAPPVIERLVGREPFSGMSVSYARLCLPWLAAVVLKNGSIGLKDFSEAKLACPKLLKTAEKFSVEVDGSDNWSTFVPAVATAKLTDGKTVTHRVEQQFGSPQWPLSREQHRQKAADCLVFGEQAGITHPLAELMGNESQFCQVPDVHRALAAIFDDRD